MRIKQYEVIMALGTLSLLFNLFGVFTDSDMLWVFAIYIAVGSPLVAISGYKLALSRQKSLGEMMIDSLSVPHAEDCSCHVCQGDYGDPSGIKAVEFDIDGVVYTATSVKRKNTFGGHDWIVFYRTSEGSQSVTPMDQWNHSAWRSTFS